MDWQLHITLGTLDEIARFLGEKMIDINKLKTLSPSEIVEYFATKIYEEPFSEFRDNMNNIPKTLRTIVFILDFDVEIAMNGILGFIENSIGLYIYQIIESLKEISAYETASTLENVIKIMEKHGVSTEKLRNNYEGRKAFEILSFSDLHGKKYENMADELVKISEKITCDDTGNEPTYELLENYIKVKKQNLIEEIKGITL